MRVSFRLKLLLLVSGLTALAMGSLSVFFLHLYRKDKVATLYERETENLTRNANALENLINLSRLTDVAHVRSSSELILLVEDPCRVGRESPHAVSDRYAEHFRQLEISPRDWSNSLDVFQACQEMKLRAADGPVLRILPARVQLMVPYLGLFLRDGATERLALITVDGLKTLPGSTLFLVDRSGGTLWSVDGEEFLASAFEDTGLSRKALASLVGGVSHAEGSYHLADVGNDGLVSFAPVGPDWFLVSLSFKPTLLAPVRYAFNQFTVLGLALLCLVLWIGRIVAGQIAKPLKDLQTQAEMIGSGRFDVKFEEKGTDEVASVKRAFNVMGGRLALLMEEKKKSAALEAELQVATGVQSLLLPPAQVRLQNQSIYSFVQSASQCGGDWWGFLEIERPGLSPLSVLMVGDVTDHGVSSALITGVVRGAVSVYSQWAREAPAALTDPCAVLNRLNTAVFEAAKSKLSMSFQVIALDSDAGKLYCANAGHPFAYLISPPSDDAESRAAVIQPVGTSSISLGTAAATVYEEVQTFPWRPGSKLLMYTDGLVDAVEGDTNHFDRRHLRKVISTHAGVPGRILLARVLEARSKAAGHLAVADDITVLVCDAV